MRPARQRGASRNAKPLTTVVVSAMTASQCLRTVLAELGLGATVVVVEPDDVVLAEVVAVLDLHEHQRQRAGVVDPVGHPDGDVYTVAALDRVVVAVEGDDPSPADHEPVLGTPLVLLVTQPLARLDLDGLHLEVTGLGQDGIGAPRALGTIGHRAIMPGRRPVSGHRAAGGHARRRGGAPTPR